MFCITLHVQGDDQQSNSLGGGAAASAHSSQAALGSPGELAQLASVLAANPVVAGIFDRLTALIKPVYSVSDSAAQPTIEPKVRNFEYRKVQSGLNFMQTGWYRGRVTFWK